MNKKQNEKKFTTTDSKLTIHLPHSKRRKHRNKKKFQVSSNLADIDLESDVFYT